MNDNKVLRHYIFWPNLLVEIYAQYISIPALWFIISQPDFFKFNWFNLVSQEVIRNFFISIPLWLLGCAKLVSIFGYFLNNRRMMQIYCLSQLLYIGIGMVSINTIIHSVRNLNIDSMWWLLQLLLSIYLALKKEDARS